MYENDNDIYNNIQFKLIQVLTKIIILKIYCPCYGDISPI
jgi:hypothetical protein